MKQHWKTVLTITLIALMGLNIAGCSSQPKLTCSQVADQLAISTSKTIQPVSRSGDSWQERHELINERAKKDKVDLLFIGDSITHGWENQPEL